MVAGAYASYRAVLLLYIGLLQFFSRDRLNFFKGLIKLDVMRISKQIAPT